MYNIRGRCSLRKVSLSSACTACAPSASGSGVAKHTVIDGSRLVFDGTGSQLFGNYIKWFLLTIITFGIYGFWLSIKMKQWVVKHTHLA